MLSSYSEAELYHERSEELQMKDGLNLIHNLSLASGSRVLDLGCGTGRLAQVLAEKVGPNGHVTGVDPNEERIRIAKENNKENNIVFLVADGETFPQGQYDVVFSNYVLHWIKDKEAVLKRVYANLCLGGKFAFTMTHAIPSLTVDLLQAMAPECEKIFMENLFLSSLDQIERLAVCSGFDIIHKKIATSSLTFSSIESAFEFNFAGTNGLINPTLVNKSGLDQLKHKYADKPIQFDEEYVCFVLSKV